jgi:D-sedoheptulose 7-phosphate isomerase
MIKIKYEESYIIMINLKKSYLKAYETLKHFIEDDENIVKTIKISQELSKTYLNGGKSLIAGNGGSNCDAMHFAEEFTGRFRKDRKALPSISLSDSSHITCVGNDYGFDFIFSKGVEALGNEGDFFFGISTSGNSKNIIEAVKQAKLKKLKTVALLGKDGGKLRGMCDYEFIVEAETSDRIQEVHMIILHIIIEGVERNLFPENY